MTERLLIEKNTKALVALHKGLKHPGPDQDRSITISQYFQRYDQLAFPGGLELGLALLVAGDAKVIESAVTFLEVDPLFHRSGYIKADLLRHLKKVQLSEDQKSRLRRVVIASRPRARFAGISTLCADSAGDHGRIPSNGLPSDSRLDIRLKRGMQNGYFRPWILCP